MGEAEEEMANEKVGIDLEGCRAGGEGGIPGRSLRRLYALGLVLVVDRRVGVGHVLLVELPRRVALVVNGEQRFAGRDDIFPNLALDRGVARFVRIVLHQGVGRGRRKRKTGEGERRSEQKGESEVALKWHNRISLRSGRAFRPAVTGYHPQYPAPVNGTKQPSTGHPYAW